jgi:hypothetical protein
MTVPVRPSASNRKSEMVTVEEEQAARQTAVLEQVVVMRTLLPVLLSNLSEIEDPRQARKVKHQLSARRESSEHHPNGCIILE